MIKMVKITRTITSRVTAPIPNLINQLVQSMKSLSNLQINLKLNSLTNSIRITKVNRIIKRKITRITIFKMAQPTKSTAPPVDKTITPIVMGVNSSAMT